MNTLLTVVVGSGVLTNDFDNNLPGLIVTAFSATSAQGGAVSVSVDGSFTYNPPANFTGNDSFPYTTTDSGSQTDSAVVKIRGQ
ncbi:MAG TPA: Ig-like domain-containing protein [Saprospiraceae bacterium]|nr:Ig-like domain-containing protein [Saprospiraceae bacterium]